MVSDAGQSPSSSGGCSPTGSAGPTGAFALFVRAYAEAGLAPGAARAGETRVERLPGAIGEVAEVNPHVVARLR